MLGQQLPGILFCDHILILAIMHRSVCHFSPCQTKTPDPIFSIGKSGSAGFTGNWPTKHIEQPQRHKHDSARTQNCTDMSHGINAQSSKFPHYICRTRQQDDLAADNMDTLAERSKAVAQGAIPKGRGFEPHRCHFDESCKPGYCCLICGYVMK